MVVIFNTIAIIGIPLLLLLIASYTRGILVELRRHNERFKRVTPEMNYKAGLRDD